MGPVQPVPKVLFNEGSRSFGRGKRTSALSPGGLLGSCWGRGGNNGGGRRSRRGRGGGDDCGGPRGRAIAQGGGDGALLDVDTTDVPVLRRIPIDNSEDSNVEVAGVSKCVGSLVVGYTSEGAAVSGRPKTDSLGVELRGPA